MAKSSRRVSMVTRPMPKVTGTSRTVKAESKTRANFHNQLLFGSGRMMPTKDATLLLSAEYVAFLVALPRSFESNA